MKKHPEWKRITALAAIVAMLLTMVPHIPFAPVEATNRRTVDPNTMDSWEQFYGPDMMTTQYAGGVWMDKSVLTDASAFPAGTVTMSDPENGFLVALSAIASHKEIYGYATTPTDTVLVMDVSDAVKASLPTLISTVNEKMTELIDDNYNHRIGVVAYAGQTGVSAYEESVTLLMPLGHYTAQDGRLLTYDGTSVSVSPSVRDENGQPLTDGNGLTPSRTVGGSNYMQAGLFEALKQFEAADPFVAEDNVQDGAHRLPVLLLLSGDAPNAATGRFDDVEGAGVSNAGNGGPEGQTDEVRFLTQLTAAYVRNRLEAHYDRVGDSLFYTVGLGTHGAVLDPARQNETLDSLWSGYLALDGSTGLELHVPPTDMLGGDHATVTIYKNAQAIDSAYVDEFFYAKDGAALNDTFDATVSELLLHSGYYPTDLEGGNPDLGGYIVFEDTIGQYMEVKEIKGIFLGDRLFTGQAMASMLNNSSDTGLGSVAVPSALGEAFRDSVKSRLGLADNTTAIDLITKAVGAGQLFYDAQTGAFSNYIAWYADAAGAYVGFWDETAQDVPPTDAAYAVRSYGFLGETGNGIRDSDMMYMTVQVRTDLDTDEQQVIWKIPAALVPLVTYNVSFDGKDEAHAENVELRREAAQPIRLVFELGLDSAINRYNIGEVYEAKHVRPDGTRVFWTNAWDASAASEDDHVTSVARFTPSENNERYYFTEDTPLYQKQGEEYRAVTDASQAVDVHGEYYRVRWIFTQESRTAIPYYEQVSEESLVEAVWDGTQHAWIVPKGTVYRRQTDRYFPKTENRSDSVRFAYNLQVSMTNASYEASTMLGNNGQLTLTPAMGIKLSKALAFEDPTAPKAFRFRLTVTDVFEQPLNGVYPTRCARTDEAIGTDSVLALQNGVAEFTLLADQTLYITDLPFGARYTVEELTQEPYRTERITVDGVAQAGTAVSGSVALNTLTDIRFVNTPTQNGDVYLCQTVSHPFAADTVLPDRTAQTDLLLTLDGQPLASQAFTVMRADGSSETAVTDQTGKATLTLGLTDTAVLRGLPAGTAYAFTAKDTAGFLLEEAACLGLQGTVKANGNVQAVLARCYRPQAVSPQDGELLVSVTASLAGRPLRAEDTFEILLEELYPDSGAAAEQLHTFTVNGESTAVLDLTDEVYDKVGTYHYRLAAIVPPQDGGVVYDTAYRRFHVDVTDEDFDGKLEIARVSDVMNTTVVQRDDGGYGVEAQFQNRYVPTVGNTVTIPVQKRFLGTAFPLNGFRFVLLDAERDTVVHASSLTDSLGQATFKIAYSADNVGTHRYRLAEVVGTVAGVTYDPTQYMLEVTVYDCLDGTTAAEYTVYDASGQPVEGTVTFENRYVPEQAVLVLSGHKELIGRVHTGNEFRFALYETEADFAYEGKQPLQTVANDYNGGVLFEALEFDTAGTYYFVVKEQQAALGGIVYDDTVYKLTVTVSEIGGVLTASCDQPTEMVFRNRYEAMPTEVSLNGTAIFTGRYLKDGELTFVLYDENGNELQAVTNNGASFGFTPLHYTQSGIYRYTVRQQQGTLGGVTYDAACYEVTVTVTDNGHGKLYAVTDYRKNGVAARDLSFRNAYTAQPTSVEITVYKELNGRAMEEGEFLFVLIGGFSGRGLHSASNDADGTVRFEPLTVYEAGTYVLRVSEVNTKLPDMLYDESSFEIIVKITDDEQGQLRETSRTVRKLGAVMPAAVFVNTFTGTVPTTASTATTAITETTVSTAITETTASVTTASTAVAASTTSVATTASTAATESTVAATVDRPSQSPNTGEGETAWLWVSVLIAAFAVVVTWRRSERPCD